MYNLNKVFKCNECGKTFTMVHSDNPTICPVPLKNGKVCFSMDITELKPIKASRYHQPYIDRCFQ